MYDYKEAMKDDIRAWMEETDQTFTDRDELNDKLWNDDSITGNASGSYYCNAYKAREAVFGDNNAEDYIREAIDDFGIDAKTIAEHFMNWEYWDVTIRCWLLYQVLDDMDDEELHIVA